MDTDVEDFNEYCDTHTDDEIRETLDEIYADGYLSSMESAEQNWI